MTRGISTSIQRLAWTGLAYSRYLGLLPEQYEGASLPDDPTPVYDVNGELLFYRALFVAEDGSSGYGDIAANPALGDLLLAIAPNAPWRADEIEQASRAALRDRYDIRPEALEMRFVAFSYPKLAAQFLDDGKEVAMLELFSWEPVPEVVTGGPALELPYGFDRWSMLDTMTTGAAREKSANFKEQLERGDAIVRTGARASVDRISREAIAPAFEPAGPFELKPIRLFVTRELHYSTRNEDHVPCYELRGQLTSVWCVAASVQMILDFYRYEYSQVRIAQELDLGTLTNPNGLPYSQDAKVATELEHLSSNALDASMNTTPNWNEFKTEINANRPLVSFVPGHSRTVAGYYESFIAPIGGTPFKGLLVYDPWPPTSGVITRWENYNTQSYRRTFTAKVKLV